MQNKWLPRRVSTWRRSPEPPLHLENQWSGSRAGYHSTFTGSTTASPVCVVDPWRDVPAPPPNQVDLVWGRPHLNLASRSHWANQPRLNFGMLREDPQKREKRMEIVSGEGKKKTGPPTPSRAPPTPPLRPPLWIPTHSHPTPTHIWPNAVGQVRSNKDDQIKFGGRNDVDWANSCNFTAPSAVNRLRWGVSQIVVDTSTILSNLVQGNTSAMAF